MPKKKIQETKKTSNNHQLIENKIQIYNFIIFAKKTANTMSISFQLKQEERKINRKFRVIESKFFGHLAAAIEYLLRPTKFALSCSI
jgi:hypothetical protein